MQNIDPHQDLVKIILENSSDSLFIVDENRHIVFATQKFYDLCGYTKEELEGKDTFLVLHPDHKEDMIHRHKQLLDSGQKNSSEYRAIKKNGDVIWCECRTTPLPNTEKYLQVVVTRDITDRKLMEFELEHRKNRYEFLQERLKDYSKDLTDIMKISDLKERLITEIHSVLPQSQPEFLVIPLENNRVHKNDSLTFYKHLKKGKLQFREEKVYTKIGENQAGQVILSLQADCIRDKMDSTWLETIIQYTSVVFENLTVIEDLISQLETTFEEKETPKWVLRMLFNLQEQQRMQLSSDLHDTVLQDQIELYRRLESLIQQEELDSITKAKLIEVEEGLLDIIHQIRVTCNELRPPMLRELGLDRALENLFEHVQLTSTYKIHFNSNKTNDFSLNEEQTISIYRVVQELLNNAEKHSGASHVNVDITVEDEFIMTYLDNGVGFDAMNYIPTSRTMGLTSMIQRVESLGGNIHFHSQQGSGLKVSIVLPLNDEHI